VQNLAPNAEISLRQCGVFAILNILQSLFNVEKVSSHSGALTTITKNKIFNNNKKSVTPSERGGGGENMADG
jgi:hypothetical protein